MPRLIAIGGGIGSGKSLVSRILVAMGYQVYDCDSRAKTLMDSSEDIKRHIAEDILSQAVTSDGTIDRAMLASEVFADKRKLDALNSIVHGAVKRDIKDWAESLNVPFCWIESAIVYESGIDRMVDEVWMVDAPEELRINRVMSRSSMSREMVKARIEAQAWPEDRIPHSVTRILINDGVVPLLPQILGLLAKLFNNK